jgi:hypothetical protein
MQADVKELGLHPFIKKLMENTQPLIEASSDKLKKVAEKRKLRSKEKTELWEHEWYDYVVFIHLSSLLSGTERLQQAQNFIVNFPQPRSYEKKGINQYTWIEYHYSYYLVTFVSLFDIALILTNSVFRLGNRERDCKADLIMNNSWVRQTPVKQALADLDQLIKPHREGRNLHIHRGQMPDIALTMELEELDMLKLYSFVQMHGKPIIDQEIIDWAYKGATKEIIEKLHGERSNVHSIIWQFFDDLLPVYEKKSIELHQKWKDLFKKAAEEELKRRAADQKSNAP